MKNKRFGFFAILAFAALASSCGTSATYSSSAYSDGIYYRPTQESRAKMIAEKEAKASRSQYDQYLARDEEGNLYVVTELMDGETYESRLHKFDTPWYVNPYWYDTWNYAWYNSWYGYPPYYGYYPYSYAVFYSPYWYSWRNPWIWGGFGYAGWYAWNRWYDYPYYHHHYYHGGGYLPGPGPSSRGTRNVVHTPRNSSTGSGIYRSTGNAGNRGMYTTRRTSTGGSVSTRTSSNGTTTVRSAGSSSRPVRTGASSGSYNTRSSGSYSSGGRSGGGSYSGGGGGGYSSGGGGGTSVSGGTHSGGGRR